MWIRLAAAASAVLIICANLLSVRWARKDRLTPPRIGALAFVPGVTAVFWLAYPVMG
ncbi:hypothetical protein [Nocardia wallacei]|uniref:hypothetical protein n=1 Tax=Nocardia wallacei TaxID=480035 RepID=UPI0024561159|nr:hypothetical protein [Nocardia wallacei]